MHLRRGAWSFHTLSNITPSVHLFHLNVCILITSFYNKLVVQEDPMDNPRLPTPVFLPGEYHGQRSLLGYCPWSHKELDMTEQLTLNSK